MKITVAQMREAGLTEAQILRLVEVADTEPSERRQEQNRKASQKYRAKLRQQNHADGDDAADGGIPSSTPNNESTLVKEGKRKDRQQNHADADDAKREFDEVFWPAYPHKVDKPGALKAWRKARKRASLETIMEGLAKYAAKTDDRPWANPATWLNGDRWNDVPGPSQESKNGRGQPKDDRHSISGAFDRLFAKLDGADEASELPRQTGLRIVSGRSGE